MLIYGAMDAWRCTASGWGILGPGLFGFPGLRWRCLCEAYVSILHVLRYVDTCRYLEENPPDQFKARKDQAALMFCDLKV